MMRALHTSTQFPTRAYLARVGLPALPPPTADGLSELVLAQVRSIAFENLDVLAGVPVRLDRAIVYEKILGAGRGGYCFELNALMSGALEAAGFDVRPVMARVTYGRTVPGPATHQALVVKCDGQEWLVDVGFGGPGPERPLPIVASKVHTVEGTQFRLVPSFGGDLHLQRKVGNEWNGLFLLSLAQTRSTDIQAANHFISSWKRSPLRHRLMCTLPVPGGLLTVQGTDLVRLDRQLSEVERRPLNDALGFYDTLRGPLRIKADPALVQRAWETAVAAIKFVTP
ncbi:arylamine N-acetyltransferase [bacterium BD-1]|uniref:arylamine N-acetyltransferase family protein n=1 Tax=Arenimonas sp. TaxID=1872635 RepID=UPI001E637AF9|nr:arylamine N-acetyltransferase [Ottowia caeni]